MKKCNTKLTLAGGAIAITLLTGCTNLMTDHGLDYQTAQASEVELELPRGSVPVKDKLVIPNEQRIADLEATGEFEAPRAPLLFQPLAQSLLKLTGDEAVMRLPITLAESRALVTDFISQFAQSREENIKFQASDTHISTTGLSLEEKTGLSKLWQSITRLEDDKFEFEVDFTESRKGTEISIQILKVKAEGERSPVDYEKNDQFASVVVDLWTSVTTDLKESQVLLSEQGKQVPKVQDALIWTRSNGELAFNLGDRFSQDSFEAYLNNIRGIHLVDGEKPSIAVVPEEQLARVGDIIDLKIPVKVSEDSDGIKLFKVRRRNLDDVEWIERSYPYTIVRQQEGYFLTVDTSATEHPKLTAYRIFSRLAN